MNLKQDLEWSETPWDDLSRPELLRELQRMFYALQHTTSTLRIAREMSGITGAGSKSLFTVAEHVLEPYEKSEDYRERIFRCFFRYAVDLLFPGLAGVGYGWYVCTCGTMQSAEAGEKPVRCIDCGKDMRQLAWSDMDPKTRETPDDALYVAPREPRIEINGTRLSEAQSAAVRVAVCSFLMEIRDGDATELGPIGPMYEARLDEVQAVLFSKDGAS